MTEKRQIATQKRLAMTGSKVDRHATLAMTGSKADRHATLVMTGSKADRHAKEARDDGKKAVWL